MKLDFVRFRGLHVVDLSRLTKHQYDLFGRNCYISQEKALERYNPVRLKYGKYLSMPEYVLKVRDWEGKKFAAFYSRSDKGKIFEKQLAKYIKAFKEMLNTIPHFDPLAKDIKAFKKMLNTKKLSGNKCVDLGIIVYNRGYEHTLY